MELPSDPAERKVIKDAMKEAGVQFTRIEAANKQLKSIFDNLKDEFGFPVKQSRKVAVTMHNMSYRAQQAEFENFEFMYESLSDESEEQEQQ